MNTEFESFTGCVGGTIISLYMFISYIINIGKLVNCDFESPFTKEIIHIIGLIPPLNMITVWF